MLCRYWMRVWLQARVGSMFWFGLTRQLRQVLRLSRCSVLAILLLPACRTAPLAHTDLRATAIVTGCWPGNYPTSNPITVTPDRPGLADIAAPLPTTTAYPRCTPVPGAPTLAPIPTSIPTPVPYP